ncbi:MAG: hypothetical protein ACOX08_11640 [Methanobacterium sp.]
MGKYQYLGDYPGITDGIGPATLVRLRILMKTRRKSQIKALSGKRWKIRKQKEAIRNDKWKSPICRDGPPGCLGNSRDYSQPVSSGDCPAWPESKT